jgi:hypothetical protein
MEGTELQGPRSIEKRGGEQAKIRVWQEERGSTYLVFSPPCDGEKACRGTQCLRESELWRGPEGLPICLLRFDSSLCSLHNEEEEEDAEEEEEDKKKKQ